MNTVDDAGGSRLRCAWQAERWLGGLGGHGRGGKVAAADNVHAAAGSEGDVAVGTAVVVLMLLLLLMYVRHEAWR